VIFLYRTYVAGILAHSLPFMDSEGWVQRGLQTAQDEFLRTILGVGENDAALHVGAELGFIDMDIQIDMAKIALYGRLKSNREDDLTEQMLKWKSGEHGETEEDKINRALHRLKIEYKAEDLEHMGKTNLKRDLKEAAREIQTQRWLADSQQHRLKENWGLEKGILNQPSIKARRYVQVRMGSYERMHKMNTYGGCSECLERDGTIIHKLWRCETNDKHRDLWGARMEKEYPGLWNSIKQMTLTVATEVILGRGEVLVGKETWESLHPIFIQHIWDVTGGWKGEQGI
jgi:hypothetical protein